MGRPAKAISQTTKNWTKEERASREAVENLMALGTDGEIIPPDYLTTDQREIFEYIVENLKEARILGELDIFALTQGAIAIDRLTKIEQQINENPDNLYNSKLMASQERYFKQFARYCNELALSPQARAKISIQVAAKTGAEKKTTIMEMLDDEE